MNDDIRTWLLNPILPRPPALPRFDRDAYGSAVLDPDEFEAAPAVSDTRELGARPEPQRRTG